MNIDTTKLESLFCLYEQALGLKELGFDEPCFGYYHDKRLTGVNKWDRKDFEFHVLSKKEVTATTVEIILAPLYQQAFRWLYKKLGIEKGVMPLDIESQLLLLNELIETLWFESSPDHKIKNTQ